MIRQDEMAPTRSRRRSYYYSIYGADTTGKLNYPLGKGPCIHDMAKSHADPPSEFVPVGRWVKENYEPNSPIMAVFMTHAVVNSNTTVRMRGVNLVWGSLTTYF
jgi:hypothetical protein